jgi:hypothetical protein
MTSIIVTDIKYTRKIPISKQDVLFIFGDNRKRIGTGGQAVLRYNENVFGICTQKDIGKFYNDIEFEENINYLNIELNNLKKIISSNVYKYVHFPIHGIGTGLAKMKKNCPKTFEYFKKTINNFLDEITPEISKTIKW